MRLHRFYVDTPIEYTKSVIKDERLIHQWRDVFRYNVGSEVILFDGNGSEFDSVIEKLNNREAEIRLVSERRGIIPEKKITLCQSLLKKDNMEWVVEKSTELGVSKIIPIISDRSEKKGFNLERAKKIAIEASEQCGRADVPKISGIMTPTGVLEQSNNVVVFDSSGILSNLSFTQDRGNPITVFIGPEGGWTEKELKIFEKEKVRVLSLGPLILRAETAAIVGVATISHAQQKT